MTKMNIPDLVLGQENIEIREEEYEEDDQNSSTTTDQFDGCSFTLPDPESCAHETETISIQVPTHTTKELWALVNTNIDQLNSYTEDEDDLDESQYTPYYSKSAIKIAE